MSLQMSTISNTGDARTATQESVATIWSELLQRSRVELEDDFFELGGDSLMLMMVLFRIKLDLGVDLHTSALVESPTLGSFSSIVEDCLRTASSGDVGPITGHAGGINGDT